MRFRVRTKNETVSTVVTCDNVHQAISKHTGARYDSIFVTRPIPKFGDVMEATFVFIVTKCVDGSLEVKDFNSGIVSWECCPEWS